MKFQGSWTFFGNFVPNKVFSIHDMNLIDSENQHSTYAKTKTQISCAVTAQLISTFVIALLLNLSEISRFRLAPVTVQAGLCRDWSEIQIVGLFMQWLIL